jgi:hemerythrin-like domain-containing protein
MKEWKNKGIKEIISQYPQVGTILEEYGIGCGPCTVGMCLLKDILDIHTLSPEKEKDLMCRIEAVIYPERGIEVSGKTPSSSAASPRFNYSPPMQRLVDEHLLIKRWLALIPAVVENLDLSTDEGVHIIEDGIDLIRNYADRLHHAKEEDILFKYFDDTAAIFQVIYEDHSKGRSHVKSMITALAAKEESLLGHHLRAYGELLAEHIKKEDEILFPWLEKRLSADQLDELSAKFNREDERLAINEEKYSTFVDRLEHRYGLEPVAL